MGKKSVYEGLRKAIELNGYPYFAFDDNEATILFSSWDQYHPFDKFLDHIETDGNTKLCIYSELVDGNHEGVAVTVSSEIQHLSYWDSKTFTRERVAAFEKMISIMLRMGLKLLDFNYNQFCVELPHDDALEFEALYKVKGATIIPEYARCYFLPNEDGSKEVSLSFPEFS